MAATFFIIVLILFCPSTSNYLYEKRIVTDLVKFVIALLIVNEHIWMYYLPESRIGSQFVLGTFAPVFMFFSSYGLMNAYQKKRKEYLNGFITFRVGKVLLPLVTAYIVTLPIYGLCKGIINWQEVLETLYWGGPYLRFTWYVTEIVVLYFLFYICAELDYHHGGNGIILSIVLSTIVLFLAFVLYITRQPIWYISGLPCFMLGIWYQRYEVMVLSIINGKRGQGIMMLVALAFAVAVQWKDIVSGIGFLSKYKYEYASLYIKNILFVVLIAYISSSKFAHRNLSPPTIWSKTVHSSYEIYLMQNACMMTCSVLIRPQWLFLICTLVMSVAVGVLMNFVNKRILKYLL